MSEVKYSREHDWVRIEGETITVGITDYAQEQLGDIVYVETPEPGSELTRGSESAVVESAKAASEIHALCDCKVTESNAALADDPSLINSDPYGKGWFYKAVLQDQAQLDDLLDEASYEQLIKEDG